MPNPPRVSKPSRAKDDGAAALIPPKPTILSLRAAARNCRACDLWKRGTQTVFGEGPANAKILFVGEQPGDREDGIGRPFVGPAGLLLDRALVEAGIDRSQVYVTNAVKHFKWEARGKRRIHKKPRASEIESCQPWLEAELAVVKPDLVVCLGATAAQALLGNGFSVMKHRGELLRSPLAPGIMATVHPSSLLRVSEDRDRRAQMKRFVQDLKKAVQYLRKAAA